MDIASRLRIVLEAWGLNLVVTATREQYDAEAPVDFRADTLLPGARGVLVVASGSRAFWNAFSIEAARDPDLLLRDHPMDTFAARALDAADAALTEAEVRFRRFEPTFYADVKLDFVALGGIVGLGAPGPFGMLIHPKYGPWWAFRGAYFVDAEVAAASPPRSLCQGCARPCVEGAPPASDRISLATFAVRSRCIVGPEERYDDAQIQYHEARLAQFVAKSYRG